MPVKPGPFGAWQPLIWACTIPPARLIDPAGAEVIFDYQSLKEFRLAHAPYIVREHYDMVQARIEARIAEQREDEWQRWLRFCEDNL